MSASLKEKLSDYRDRVESGIDRLLPAIDTRPARLHEAMRYSLEAGGKRIRPVLLLASADLFPIENDPLPAAVAIECLHTYTLIHDDLPCVDDSNLRRGRLACHAAFDQATALLAGDALLTYAFELLATAYSNAAELSRSLVAELANAAGSQRLIGGQMEDIANESRTTPPETLHFIHENKTGALLSAALVLGLRFAGPDDRQIRMAQKAGFHLGMTFQIVDDILDATSDAKHLGKPTGRDSEAKKTTYPALFGLEASQKKAKEHTEACIDALQRLGGRNHFLSELATSLEHRAR